MAARGVIAPVGEGLRYAEYLQPSAKRPDADVDQQGLVSAASGPHPRLAPL